MNKGGKTPPINAHFLTHLFTIIKAKIALIINAISNRRPNNIHSFHIKARFDNNEGMKMFQDT